MTDRQTVANTDVRIEANIYKYIDIAIYIYIYFCPFPIKVIIIYINIYNYMTDRQTDRQTARNFLYANNGHIHRIATHALFFGGETLYRHR